VRPDPTAWRRLGQLLCVACLVGGAAVFAVEVTRPATHAAAQVTPRPAPTPTATGANLADPELVNEFLSGATSDIAAVTTYDYRDLEDALNAGLAVTTGSYRTAYRQALTGALRETALQEHVIHTFELTDIGIGEMNARGTVAKVLVFGQQLVTDDQTGGRPQLSPITLCATIRRDGDLFRISDLVEGASAGLPPGGPDLPVAAEAGRSEVANLLSYRRADFQADLERALAGATGGLTTEIERNAAATRAAMRAGGYDLRGTVTAVAVLSAGTDSVTLLVGAASSRLADGAAAPVVTYPRYEVTVVRTSTGWATSDVSPVDGT
jgi:hypothetical protein